MADSSRREKDLDLVEDFKTVRAITEDGRSVQVPKSMFGGNLEVASDNVLGGIKASPKSDTDTNEVKIDPNTGRLYCPSSEVAMATAEKIGGIVAGAKTSEETEEVKIDPNTGKAYVKPSSTLEVATAEKLGGVKAETRTEAYTVEAKIDEETGKLYVPESKGTPPDDEDITVSSIDGSNALRFKNRDTSNGMGYVILRTNKSLAEQLTQLNTIYEVRYNFDLNGETLTLPANCVLKFNGGKISNGTIIGKESVVDSLPAPIFESVTIQGTFNNEKIYSEWFVAESDMDKIKAAIDGFGRVDLLAKTYNCDKEIVVSNVSYIKGDGATILSTASTQYKFRIGESGNLYIKGITFDSDMISRGALHVSNCDYLYIDDCTFKNHAQLEEYYQTDSQVCTETCKRFKITGCIFDNIGLAANGLDKLIRCISDQNGETSIIESCVFTNVNQAIVASTPNSIISNCYFESVTHNGIYGFKPNLTVIGNTFKKVIQPVISSGGSGVDVVTIISNNKFINSVNRVVRLNGSIHTLKLSNNIITSDYMQGSLFVTTNYNTATSNTIKNLEISGNKIDYSEAEFQYDYAYSFIYIDGQWNVGNIRITDNEIKNCWRANDVIINILAPTLDSVTDTIGDVCIFNNFFESTNGEVTLEQISRKMSLYYKNHNKYTNIKSLANIHEDCLLSGLDSYNKGLPKSIKYVTNYPTPTFLSYGILQEGDIAYPKAITADSDYGKRSTIDSDGKFVLKPMPNVVYHDLSSNLANGFTGSAFLIRCMDKMLLYLNVKATQAVADYGYILYNVDPYIFNTSTSYPVYIDDGYILSTKANSIQINRIYGGGAPQDAWVRTNGLIVLDRAGNAGANYPTVGPTSKRPTSAPRGYFFYDATLNKPIWSKGDGTWIDATGIEI